MATQQKGGRVAIWPGLEEGVPRPLMPYSPAIRAGGWLFVAGTIASDFKTGLAPEVKAANPYLTGELEVQGRYVLRNLAATIKAAGCDIRKDMVRIWQWPVSERPTPEEFAQGDNWMRLDIAPYLRARADIAGEPCVPSSILGVRELLCRGTKIEVEMICIEDGGQNILFDAPEGVSSSYSASVPALRRGDWVFLGAQSAIDPSTRPADLESTSIEQQTDYVLRKLARIAEHAGSSLDRTVKAEVYIGSVRDFAGLDHVWRQWFPKNPPARVVIPHLGMLGAGRRVEIALTMLAKDSKLKIETIDTPAAPRPLGHEPQAVKVGQLLFFSTQMAFDSDGRLPEGMVRHPEFPWYGSPGQAQMRYIMKNVSEICRAAGTTVDNIVRRVCFHNDFQWFAESIAEWASYFPEDKPASTTLRIDGPFVVPGANTLLDLTAYVPG